jgi:hypothetical protein
VSVNTGPLRPCYRADRLQEGSDEYTNSKRSAGRVCISEKLGHCAKTPSRTVVEKVSPGARLDGAAAENISSIEADPPGLDWLSPLRRRAPSHSQQLSPNLRSCSIQ